MLLFHLLSTSNHVFCKRGRKILNLEICKYVNIPTNCIKKISDYYSYSLTKTRGSWSKFRAGSRLATLKMTGPCLMARNSLMASS